jgi:diaminopimelate decarboxylase
MNQELIKNFCDKTLAPFYLYNLDELAQHAQMIQEVSQGIAKIWYATKANPLSSVIHTLSQQNYSFDVASMGELNQVKSQGVMGENILVTGPGKSKKLLNSYLEAGVRTFVVESHQQLSWLDECAANYGVKPLVLLRLQLEWDDGEKSVLGGNQITPFGLDHKSWQDINLANFKHVYVKGVHIFQWGNILDSNKLTAIWDYSLKSANILASDLGFDLSIVDVGGGLGVPYQGEKTLIFSQLMNRLQDLKHKYYIDEIWMELGRFLTGPMGSFYTQVIDKKLCRGKNILVIESGLNHMARPGVIGQGFPGKCFHPHETTTKKYQVHGSLCTALDYFGEYDLPESIQAGDWLEFQMCGAYGFTESMPFFLCHNMCGEAISKNGHIKMVREPVDASFYLR